MKQVLCFIYFCLTALSLHAEINYRTKASGNYSNAGIWEWQDSANPGIWHSAITAPVSGMYNISIEAAHTLNLDVDVILNDSNLTTAPDVSVKGKLIFTTHFIQGEPLSTGGSQFAAIDNSTLEINNSNGLRNASIGALKNFAQYTLSPLVNYIFTSTAIQSMNIGTDSVQDITINGSSGIINSSAPIIVSGTLRLQAGTFHLNHLLTLTGNPINITSSGTMTGGNNAAIHFRTTVPGHFIPAGISHLKKLELNTVSTTSIALNAPLVIDDAYGLTLTKGILNTGVHTLTLSSDLLTPGNANSFVNGTLAILCETFSESHFENIVFPVGGNAYQPFSLNLSTLTNTGGTYLSVKAFENIPAGTSNLIDLGGPLSNRYWQIKVIHNPANQNTNHIAQIASVDLAPNGLIPALSGNAKIGFSTNNQSLSFSGITSSISTGHIISGSFNNAQIADIGSADGSFVGIASSSFAAGTYCIGPSASYTPPAGVTYLNANSPYPTITAALSALNTLGNEGHVIFELQNNYVSTNEANPIAITYSGSPNRTVTFKVRSDLSVPLVIEKGMSAGVGVLFFNAARYVTFDGRIGNNACHASYGLIIRNTSAPIVNQNFGVGTTTLSFKNDAHHITIKGLQIDMADNGISFDNSIGTQGCDSIQIECNKLKIRNDLLNTNCFANGIRISHYNGIAPAASSNDIFIDNNYFDNCAYGIYISDGATGLFTISNNSMYRSTNTIPGPAFYSFLWSSNNFLQLNFNVSHNYFGGTAPLCSGAKMDIRGVGNYLHLFQCAQSTVSKSVFNHNHIENITYSASNMIYAVSMQSGIWDIIGNTIGNPSVPQDIISSASNSFYGIHFSSNSNASNTSLSNRIEQNSFNNISFNGAAGSEFHGIFHTGNVQTFIQSNSFKNISSTANIYYWLIKATVHNVLSNQTNYFNYNTADNIQQISSSLYEGGGFTVLNGFGNSKWDIIGNRLGSLTNSNDILFNGPAASPFKVNFTTGINRMDSNIVSHVQLTATITNIPQVMMDITSNHISNCAYNKVMNCSSMSRYYEAEGTLGTGASLNGIRIFVDGTSIPTNIHHNIIHGLQNINTSTQTNGIGIIGLLYSGSNFAGLRNSLYQNEIHDLSNQAVSSGTNPYIHGIHVRTGNIVLYNNRISLSNSSLTNTVNMTGIYKQVSNIPFSCYHNTISISGTSTASGKSYAFRKGSSNGTDTIKNNIFQNTRNGSGLHYAMSNYATNTGTWGSCNFNDVYTNNAATTIESVDGTSSTFNQWQTLSGKDANSKNLFVTFIDSNLDLHISPSSNCGINAAGGSGTHVLQDMDGETRNTNTPDMGADEFQGDIFLEAGTEKFICKDSLQLDGQSEPGSTGFWTGTGLSFTPNNTSAQATVHGLTNGLHTLIWHVSNTVCIATDTLLLHTGTQAAPMYTTYTIPICHDRDVSISLGSPLVSGMWSTGDTSQTIVVAPSTTTTYSVNGTDIYNCLVDTQISIQVIPLPTLLAASPALPIHSDPTVAIPVSFSWSPDFGSSQSELMIWPDNQSRPLNGISVTGQTSATIQSLPNEQSHYWQIKSMNQCDTVFSDTSSFTTNYPDLQVESVSAPGIAYANTSLPISWTVKNISNNGSTGTTSWIDVIYLSEDTILDGFDIQLGVFNNQAYLNGGVSYTQQKQLAIHSSLSGHFNVLVKTDINNSVHEADENNNILLDSIFIQPALVSDLKILSVASPSNAFANDSITVTYVVENDGQIPTQPILWNDEIYISPSPVFNNSAVSLGKVSSGNVHVDTVYHNHPTTGPFIYQIISTPTVFALNETYLAHRKVKLPSNYLSGAYYMYVKTNVDGHVLEGAYAANNVAKSPIVLNLTQLPPSDLIVDTIMTPGSAASGKPISLSWKVRNQGSAITTESTWIDRVYFNSANSFTGAILLGTYTRTQQLAKDSSYTVNFSAILPNGLQGNYFFMVKTDEANVVFEYLSDSNNSRIMNNPIPILLSPSPDLIITQAQIASGTDTSITPNQISFTIKNIGDTTTDRSFGILLYRDSVANYSVTSSSMTNLTHHVLLAPGDSVTRTINFTTPAAGLHYLFLIVDGTNALYEHNGETNNQFPSIQLNSIAAPPTYSSVSIYSSSAPASVSTEQSYILTYTVTNQGPDKTSAAGWQDHLYLSADSILQNTDLLLLNVQDIVGLDSNQQYARTKSFTIPAGIPSGNYYFILQTDRYNYNTNDSNKLDNIVLIPVTNTLVPSPDVNVQNIEAEDTLYAQQGCWLKFTVHNNGPGSISQKYILNRVYLSTNLISLQNHLGSSNRLIDLPSGASYIDSVWAVIPSFASGYHFIIVVSDYANAVYEGTQELNNRNYTTTYIEQNSGIELVPLSIDFLQDSLSLGDQVNANYAYTNTGTKALTAFLRNATYFSKDSLFDGLNDVLFEIKDSNVMIAPGDTVMASMTGIVKDTKPDWYSPLLRLNINASYPEFDLDNNQLTGDSVYIDVKELQVNIPKIVTLPYGQFLYYKINVPAEHDMIVRIKQLSGGGQNVGLISYNKVPTKSASDFMADDEAKIDQQLLIPGTQAGTYYLLIYSKYPVIGNQMIEVKAELLPLTILSIETNEGGQGVVGNTIYGAGFRDSSVVELRLNSTILATATIVDYISSMQMELEWDLTTVPVGLYDLVIHTGTNFATLPASFHVEVTEADHVAMTLEYPKSVGPGDKFTTYLRYTNIGNVNIASLKIQSKLPYHSVTSENVFPGPKHPAIIPPGYPPASLKNGYAINLKPSKYASITYKTIAPNSKTGTVLTGTTKIRTSTPKNILQFQLSRLEKFRQVILEYVTAHAPSMVSPFANKLYFYEKMLQADSVSYYTSAELYDAFNLLEDEYIDFNPGEQKTGTYYEDTIRLKSKDVYRWEINVPTINLGASPGGDKGWDLLKSLGNIDISADSIDPFEIVIIPRNPCNQLYASLTTWEPWHDYSWPIATATGSINGFHPSKFKLNTLFFERVNNTHGGHFNVSVSGDTLLLNFIHKVRNCGEAAYDGGPGLCGYPGGNGESDTCGNGTGGDGGRGWGIGSIGGNGGNGPGGGGFGGVGLGGNGLPGQDTQMDNDNDGVADTVDNCLNVFNPSQSDNDGDGIGNECDPEPGTPNPDNDLDGIPDGFDLCPNVANIHHADFDGDGIGDACDNTIDFDCIQGLTCPTALDCMDEKGCMPVTCTGCPPSGPGVISSPASPTPLPTGGPSSPPSPGNTPEGASACSQNLKAMGCKDIAIACLESKLEEIVLQGGMIDPITTAGAKNRDILKNALVDCGLECLESKIPGSKCVHAATGIGRSLIDLVEGLSLESITGVFSAEQAVEEECLVDRDPIQECFDITVFGSMDPNEIIGPPGEGDTLTRWVTATRSMGYQINFENDSVFATAPAKRIVITQDIDPNLDPLSFKLDKVSFQNVSFDLPKLANYTGVINLDDSLNYDVEVTAGLDIVNHKVFWVLQSINPLTGLPPASVFDGLLPVNDSTGKGKGFVTYTILPKNIVNTQDTAIAKAEITFDINEPIQTNTWKNTFDAVKPVSSLDTVPSFIPTDSIWLPVQASDDINGSGVYGIRLFYQINGGDFSNYIDYLPYDSLFFQGVEGNSYGFYTIAFDTAGNLENEKYNAQWSVQFGYPDSIEITSPSPFTDFCEQSVMPVQWSSYHVENLQLRASNTLGDVLFVTPYFSDSTGLYNWTVPYTIYDTLIIRLVDALTEATFDADTILISHLKIWYKDNDLDGYFVDTPIVSCVNPGIGYVNTIIAGGDCNDNAAAIHPNSSEICCNGIDDNCNGLIDESNLHLTLFLQGYYNGGGFMAPCLMNQGIGFGNSICDTIEILLVDPNTFAIAATTKTMLNTDGTAICGFQNVGGLYYIVIKHRNTLTTWSANPIPIAIAGENAFYNFTNAADKAYGDNQHEVEPGIWALFTGDLNQDENVDLLDLPLLEADITNFEFGYFATDINGDGNVDLLDNPLVEENISDFVFSNHP